MRERGGYEAVLHEDVREHHAADELRNGAHSLSVARLLVVAQMYEREDYVGEDQDRVEAPAA